LRPAEECCEHLAGLIAVIVDRLLAENDKPGRFLCHNRLQELGDGKGLNVLIGFDVNAAVGAHGECGADRLLGLGRTDRDRDHLRRLARFPEPDRFLDADFVERVHRHLDVGGLDAGLVRLDPDFHVEIDDPLDRDQNLHCTSYGMDSGFACLWGRSLPVKQRPGPSNERQHEKTAEIRAKSVISQLHTMPANGACQLWGEAHGAIGRPLTGFRPAPTARPWHPYR